MENQNKDNLENFFKNKFDEPTKKDGWNTPDDFVWQNIAQSLKRPSSNKRFLLFLTWVLLGLLTFLSGYLFLQNQQKTESIKELNKKIELCLGNQTEKKFEDQELAQKSLIGNSNEINTENILLKSSQVKTTTTVFDKQNHLRELHFQEKNVEKSQIEKPLLSIPNQENIDNSNISNLGLINNKIDQISINLINSIGLKNVESNSETSKNIAVKEHFTNIKTLEKINNQKITRLGFGYAGFQWFNNQQTKGQLSELILRERYLFSSGFGIDLEKQIGVKWIAKLGFTYHKRRFDTEFLLNLPYDKNLENMSSDDSFEQIFAHSLPTALGNVSSTLALRRSSASIINTIEPVALDFIIENSTDIVSIPIIFQFHPHSVIKDGIFFTGGLSPNLFINQNIEVVKQFSHHAQITGNSVDLKLEEKRGSQIDLGILLGIGYQKLILPKWNILFQASYRNTIFNQGENIEASIKSFHTISR